MMCVPTSVKAEMEYDPVITEEIVYQDAQYMIRVITIVEQENVSFFATTNTKSVSRVWTVENVFGNVVASYTLKGTFSYDGTTATCISATYTTNTDSILWSFESATAYASGAKAIGSFTAKNLLKTVSETLTLTCSKIGVIS